MIDIEKLKAYLDSPEGLKSTQEYFDKYTHTDNISLSQYDRFDKRVNKNSFKELVDKIIIKYNSDKYYQRWMSRGMEPPQDLFWFLFEYSKKYGRECNDDELSEYGNMFTSELYYIYGYFFNLMNGQGSAIKVIKENGRK